MNVLRRPWMRRHPISEPVLLAGRDAPRDLDDPLSDPSVQARVGEAISKLARRKRN